MRHAWSILTNSSIVNKDDNTLSLIGVTENITVGLTVDNPIPKGAGQIGLPVKFELISFFYTLSKSEDLEGELRLTITDPRGKDSEPIAVPLKIGEDLRLRSIVQFQSFTYTVDGTYIFKVEFKTKSQKAYTLATTIPVRIKLNVTSSPKAEKTL